MPQKLSIEEFISRSKCIHNNKYDYSNVDYVNSETKVCIICPKHGEFWQTPHMHLSGQGCPYCKGKHKTTEMFIRELKEIFPEYDYSKVVYVNNTTKVCIICPEHGEFWQKPNNILNGHGCSKCRGGVSYDKETFIEKANCVHNDRYDYSKVEYKNSQTPVCIICPEHGEFWQRPDMHLRGEGCPTCNKSKLEFEVKSIFTEYEEEKTFEWLKDDKSMRLDFYLSEYNIAIECQGKQHFKQVWFGMKEYSKRYSYSKLENVQKRDSLKYELCKEHNIDILYYFPEEYLKYDVDFYKDKKCFHNIDDLKNYIDKIDL